MYSLESEVRELRRAVEKHSSSSEEVSSSDSGDGFAMAVVMGFVLFLILI